MKRHSIKCSLSLAVLLICLLLTVWPAYWTNRLLLVRGLSAKTKPDELKSVFPEAAGIVVTKDMAKAQPQCGRNREKMFINRKDDG